MRIALEKTTRGVLNITVAKVERVGDMRTTIHVHVEPALMSHDEGTQALFVSLKAEMSDTAFLKSGDVDANGVRFSVQGPGTQATFRRRARPCTPSQLR